VQNWATVGSVTTKDAWNEPLAICVLVLLLPNAVLVPSRTLTLPDELKPEPLTTIVVPIGPEGGVTVMSAAAAGNASCGAIDQARRRSAPENVERNRRKGSPQSWSSAARQPGIVPGSSAVRTGAGASPIVAKNRQDVKKWASIVPERPSATLLRSLEARKLVAWLAPAPAEAPARTPRRETS
jgi:hypothetical protein